MVVSDCFDERGYLNFDPLRNVDSPMWGVLFDKALGMPFIKDDVGPEIHRLIEENGWSYMCDAAALIHAEVFANSTHGSYSVVDYWK